MCSAMLLSVVTADRTVEVTIGLRWSAKHINVVPLNVTLCDSEPDLTLEPSYQRHCSIEDYA